jgi:hypothetical protein
MPPSDPDDLAARWLAVCHAVRDWAIAVPHEYALIYGSPVPGYKAPQDTVPAATRSVTVLGRVLQRRCRARPFAGARKRTTAAPSPHRRADRREHLPDVPPPVLARGLGAWIQLFGATSASSCSASWHRSSDDPRAFFDHQMRAQARYVGI